MQAFRPFQRMFDFKGRSGCAEYWQFVLFTTLGNWLANVIDGLIGDDEFYAGAPSYGYLSLIFGLVTLIPSVSVGFRRMHDRGQAGWLHPVIGGAILTALIIFVVGIAENERTGDATVLQIGGLLSMIAAAPTIWLLIELCRAGDERSKAYGPPDDRSEAPAASPPRYAMASPPPLQAAQPPTPPPPVAAAESLDDKISAIERLGRLKEQGLLTEEEFAAQKQRLLGGDRSSAGRGL